MTHKQDAREEYRQLQAEEQLKVSVVFTLTINFINHLVKMHDMPLVTVNMNSYGRESLVFNADIFHSQGQVSLKRLCTGSFIMVLSNERATMSHMTNLTKTSTNFSIHLSLLSMASDKPQMFLKIRISEFSSAILISLG